MPRIERIPILLLTGFLGSGKTTLLRSLLNGPDADDTAVIVNEFGEVGLDHHLLAGASETMFVLENGCICCSVRDDLEASLEELFWRRLRREIPRFSRVVIETTGLAEPSRVLSLFADDSFVAERFEWAAIVSAVDGLSGVSTIDRYSEAFAQATSADRLIITKTDLASRDMIDVLEQRLQILNPRAGIHRSSKGTLCVPLAALMASTRSAEERQGHRKRDQSSGPAHSSDVTSCWLRFAAPVGRSDFSAAFSTLVNKFGSNILRAKGLLEFTGESALAVVQYVWGGTLQIADPAFPKDKTHSPGLVVFTSAVDVCDVADTFTAAGLSAVAHHDASHEHHHPSGDQHAN